MGEFILNRIKKVAPYAVFFWGASVYFYFTKDYDLAFYFLVAAGIVLAVSYIIIKLKA